MRVLLVFLISLLPAALLAQSQSSTSQPPSVARASAKTTEVIVMVTAKKGVDRGQILKVLPREIRATVKLYLDGEIQQWYSRGDGRGVVLVLDAKTVEEAQAMVDKLPLSRENLVDYEYIPVGPLLPLASLIGDGPAPQ